jgi:adenylate cyclase
MWRILTSHWLVGLLMLLAGLAYHRSNHDWLEALRHHTFDIYQQIHPREPNPAQMPAQVAIIDIDEASLQDIGQWPWSRNILADLVDKLMGYGVAVVGFDSVFAEKDRTSPERIVQEWQGLSDKAREEIAKLPSNEDAFAGAIARGRVVMGHVGVHNETPDRTPAAKVGYGYLSDDAEAKIHPYMKGYRGIINNLDKFEEAADGIGLFSITPGYGGTIRKVPLIERINGKTYPALTLEMLRVALGGKDDYLVRGFRDGTPGIKSIVVKGGHPSMSFEIPTNPNAEVWVHFARYPTAKPPLYISARDVLLAEGEKVQQVRQWLQGKLVILGTSAIGLKDIRKTPINTVMPGVEVHAQLLETILSDSHLTRPFEVIMIEWGLILIGGIMMIILVPRLNSIWTFLLAIALIGSLLGIAWHYYTSARELVDASYPSLCIFSMFVVLSYLNYMREERERAQVKDAFSHYVSPALLEQLAENPEKLSLGGETREISVLFSDIRGFTTISERFNAQELTRFINKFLTPMTNVILERQGTIDKYMGDAIMAFWNAPLEVPNHPHQACHAALEMQVAVKALNELLREESESEGGAQYMPINIGVGINTDECCVGNMGSDQRFDYSALGDGVNLGARLEGQSKTYGVDIVLGPNTYEAVKDDFATIELDLIQVKGKTEPVQIYALLGGENVRDDASFRQLKQYAQQMIASYRRCEWDEAEAAAKSMAAADASLQTLAQLYFGRIAEYRKTPPPDDWAGVFIATSK